MNDTTKLPKWAQDKIRTLEANLERANRLLSEVRNEAETNTTMIDFGADKEFGLFNNARVRFKFSPNRYIDCRVHDGKLDVCGICPLTIEPSASNRVTITAT